MSIVLLLLRLTVILGDEEKMATDSYGVFEQSESDWCVF